MPTGHSPEIVATCEAAISYLDAHGLGRRSYLRDDGRACTAGALMIAHVGGHASAIWNARHADEALRTCPAIPAVAEVVREQYPERALGGNPLGGNPSVAIWNAGAIFNFNDDVRTTQADVVEVLRETIKRHTPDEYRGGPA